MAKEVGHVPLGPHPRSAERPSSMSLDVVLASGVPKIEVCFDINVEDGT